MAFVRPRGKAVFGVWNPIAITIVIVITITIARAAACPFVRLRGGALVWETARRFRGWSPIARSSLGLSPSYPSARSMSTNNITLDNETIARNSLGLSSSFPCSFHECYNLSHYSIPILIHKKHHRPLKLLLLQLKYKHCTVWRYSIPIHRLQGAAYAWAPELQRRALWYFICRQDFAASQRGILHRFRFCKNISFVGKILQQHEEDYCTGLGGVLQQCK